jgi:hypothetical protein
MVSVSGNLWEEMTFGVIVLGKDRGLEEKLVRFK